jgi:hypothetical protein
MFARSRFYGAFVALTAACFTPAAAYAQFQAPTLAPNGSPPDPGQRPARLQPLAPVSPAAQTKTVLAVAAFFAEKLPIKDGLLWRVFSDQADINGNFPLVDESKDARPLFSLDPGGYVVHASYGLASTTEHVVLGSGSSSADLTLNAGALRLTATVNEHEIKNDVSFQIIKTEGGIEHAVLDDAKPGQIVRLTAGSYQIASTYGNANARIQVDLNVEPGKLTDATINHKAAQVQLKLMKSGSTAAAGDTTWSVMTPGGDPVTSATGAAPTFVLAEGDYIAGAQNGGQNLQKEFTVRSGETVEIGLGAP